MYIDFKNMTVSEIEASLRDLQGLVWHYAMIGRSWHYAMIGTYGAASRAAPIMKCQDIGHAILKKKRVAAT